MRPKRFAARVGSAPRGRGAFTHLLEEQVSGAVPPMKQSRVHRVVGLSLWQFRDEKLDHGIKAHGRTNNILQCEDKSSEQIFYSPWSQRIATALQVGNATMIYNIPRGISVKSRATGDRVTDEPPSRSAHPAMDVQGALLAGNDTYSESESDSNSEPEPDTPI